jgi:DNA mismatch endonuclease (patch repair protein)
MHPRRNSAYWAAKIGINVERDRRSDELLAAAGWVVIRGWEHEPPEEIADRVAEAVVRRRL